MHLQRPAAHLLIDTLRHKSKRKKMKLDSEALCQAANLRQTDQNPKPEAHVYLMLLTCYTHLGRYH